jgi:phosphatidylethanolamine-binding protein (PEBP) family uncharacterized protein
MKRPIISKHFFVLDKPITKSNPKNRSMFSQKYKKKVNTSKVVHQANLINQVMRLLRTRNQYSTPSPPRPRGRFNAVMPPNNNALHRYMVTSIKYHHQKAGSPLLHKRSTPAAYMFANPKNNTRTRRAGGKSRSV